MSNTATIEVVQAGSDGRLTGSGTVAARLMQSDFNVNSLRTQDVLRLREWIQFDNKVIMVARQRLVAVQDLLSAGLTYEVANALGITQVQYERFSDLGPAIVSMSGVTPAQNDRFDIDLQSVPLPIVHKDFMVNIRQLASYRNLGQPLDTVQAGLAARIVSETIEAMLFNGTAVGSASNTITGYTTLSARITGSVTANWATSSTTGAEIVADAIAMQAALQAKNMFGPYMLYVTVAAWNNLQNDFKTYGTVSTIQRLRELEGIIDVKSSANLTGSSVIMVQFTDDVVDMIDGIQPTVVQWEGQGGMVVHFKVMAIMVPRLKSDRNSQCGIAHYS